MNLPRRASVRWIAGMLTLMVMAPVIAWKFLPGRVPQYIIEDFIPEHISFAAHVHDLHDAWKNHWINRDTTSTRALIGILEATGVWEQWQREYGANGLHTKLGLLEEIVGKNIDREAWVFFGSWGSNGDDLSGEVGLAIVLESDGPIGKRIGPILDYSVDDYRFTTSVMGDFKLYDLEPEGWEGDHLVFFHAGKWIVGILQTRNSGPLEQLLDRLGKGPLTMDQTEDFREFFRVSGSQSPLELLFNPSHFWAQFRIFHAQRNKRLSQDSEDVLKYWQQRLEGIQWIQLSHRGPHLLDLDLSITGERPELVAQNLADRSKLIAKTIMKNPPPAASQPSNSCPVAQLDFSLPMARMIVPLSGYSWDLMLEDLAMTGIVDESLLRLPRDLLANDDRLDIGRVGLSAYQTSVGWLPAIGFWADHQAESGLKMPSSLWVDSAATSTAEMIWMSPLGVRPGEHSCDSWREYTQDIWELNDRIPEAFVAVNFTVVAQLLHGFPVIMIPDADFREEWAKILKAVDLVALGVGEIAVRLDVGKEKWTLSSYAR